MDENSTLTIASTTQNEEELKHALSDDWRTPPPAKEEPGKKDDSETGKESGEKKEGKSETEKLSPELQAIVDRRIKRELAKHKADLEELEELRAKKPKEEAKPAAAKETDPQPKREGFNSEEEFIRALGRWEARQEIRAQDAKKLEAEQEAETRAVFDAHNERLAEAQEKYEDFDEKLKATKMPWKAENPRDVAASKAFQLAIFESENGPEVLYYLATHPEVVEQFEGLSPVRTQLLVGRISASLLPSDKTPKEKPKTKVAAPIKTVGAAPSNSDVPLEKMNYQDYKRARAAGRLN